MNRTELETFFRDAEKKAAPAELTYYAKAGKAMFFVRVVGEDGKPVQKKHAVTGAPMFAGSKAIFEEVSEQFEPMVATRSSKADALCFKTVKSDAAGVFTSYQKEMIAVLEGMADNEASQIVREADYKRERNPEAYKREQELAALRKEHVAKVEKAYEKGKDEARAEVKTEMDKLREQLAAAEALLNDTGKPHQQGGRKN